MNVSGYDVREIPETVVKLLADTPIQWLRVHPLPNRHLEEKGSTGHSYIEGVDYLCKSGYNIVAPIEVGYTLNVGSIPINKLEEFIEESYHESFKATKKISEVIKNNNRHVIYCIENEIDVKSWIFQALPGIGWRGQFETWAKQAVDFGLKYRRLNNILKGVKDADPDAKTLANVAAEDARVFLENFGFRNQIMNHSNLLAEHNIQIKNILDETIDWKVELRYINSHLDVDYIGLDTYPNYILKYPVYGQDTASKLNEAAQLSEKPIINIEFGYSTYRDPLEKVLFSLLGRPNSSKMQLQFFKNSLSSIESSLLSNGTFPWVLITHPDLPASNPKQEAYFGLFKMDKNKTILRKEPAFDYYVGWLRKIGTLSLEK